MKTSLGQIVNPNYIGKQENPIALNDILRAAAEENVTPSNQAHEKVLFLGIDIQQDFMDNGALGVPGAIGDVDRITQFIYHNIDKITNITASIDTHIPQQIFHPCWWVDKDGNNPAPSTPITLTDLDNGVWRPIIKPLDSREYVQHLEQDGKKTLVVWPYHCIQGTSGCALDPQFSNIVYFHSVVRKAAVFNLVKGLDPLSEMYGIIRPEWSKNNFVNTKFLNSVTKYDKIVIAGEAKSHCVLESIKQILEAYTGQTDVTSKFYILEDCMSCIPGFEDETNNTFDDFKQKYKVNLVKSTDDIL